MDNKVKHLEFIQGVVNRLSTNSFLLKGWSVVLIAALFALSAKDASYEYLFLAYIPLIAFWGLDGFFLWQERVYRKLYDHVRKIDNAEIDFCMDTRKVSDDVSGWLNAVFSKTLLIFHGVLTFALVVVMLIQMFKG